MRILFELHANGKFPLGKNKDPYIEIELNFPCRVNKGDIFSEKIFIVDDISDEVKEWIIDFYFIAESIGFEKDSKGIYQYAICCGY